MTIPLSTHSIGVVSPLHMPRAAAIAVAVLLATAMTGALLHGHPRGGEIPHLKPYDPLH